jgi:non-heme chloroperoxidase
MSKIIFMIHGMWGGAWHWDKYQRYFTDKGYNCVVPNLRHHEVGPDDSLHPELGKTSLLDYANDLELEIKKLDEKPIIMGHSMGGLIAQILASRGLADKAVFIVTAAPAGILTFESSVFKSFQDILFNWGFWKKPHKLTYEKSVYALMHKLPEDERRYMYNRSIHESGRALAEIVFGSFGMKGSQVDSSKISRPVLVISASEDHITPPSLVKSVDKKYRPHSTYIEYPDHAHWITREPGWEQVADDIIYWLNDGSGIEVSVY